MPNLGGMGRHAILLSFLALLFNQISNRNIGESPRGNVLRIGPEIKAIATLYLERFHKNRNQKDGLT